MRRLGLLLAAVGCLLPCTAPSAFAAAADRPVTISPIINPLTIEPGGDATYVVTVKNQAPVDVRVRAKAHDVPVRADGSRSLRFVKSGSTPLGAGAWLTVEPGTSVVRSGAERPVTVHVHVPRDAEAGDHLGGVEFLIDPVGGTGEITLTQAIATYVFVQVGADARRDLRVSVRPADGLVWRGGPTTWLVTTRNAGNVHETVTGQLKVGGA